MRIQLIEPIREIPTDHTLLRFEGRDLYVKGNSEIQIYYCGEKITSMTHSVNKKYHRDTQKGPALYFWYDDGHTTQAYYINGQSHRHWESGPAYYEFDANSKLREQLYLYQGACHRPSKEGPALSQWFEDGRSRCHAYYENGELHRPKQDGPALIGWDANGNEYHSYWEFGIKLSAASSSY